MGSEKVVNRFTLNDVLATSDQPFRSILRISRSEAYPEYGGMTDSLMLAITCE